MRVRIVETLQSGTQTINAGVMAEVSDALAEDWIARGLAQAVEQKSPLAPEADDVKVPAADATPAQPAQRARRAKG